MLLCDQSPGPHQHFGSLKGGVLGGKRRIGCLVVRRVRGCQEAGLVRTSRTECLAPQADAYSLGSAISRGHFYTIAACSTIESRISGWPVFRVGLTDEYGDERR